MGILINAAGISNSGGVVVLEKLILELIEAKKDCKFIFLVTNNIQVDAFIEKYKKNLSFSFRSVDFKNSLSRLLYKKISSMNLCLKKYLFVFFSV